MISDCASTAQIPLRYFRRVLVGLDLAPVLRELEVRPELWDLLTLRQDHEGSAHRDTKTIALRGPMTTKGLFENLDAIDYELLGQLPETFALLCHITRAIQAREIGRIMLVKLLGGGHVKPHVDEGRYARYFARFHAVLLSSPSCWFHASGERVHMAPGELWWFNHQVEHEVRNGGPDRVHLIFDATAPGYTGALGVPA